MACLTNALFVLALVNPLDKQFNIIHVIRAGICKTKIKWSSKHIKGQHQNQAALIFCDKARWNDATDQAAKNHWQMIQTSPDPTMHSLLGEPWELWLDNEKIRLKLNIDYLITPVGKLPENTGQTKPNSMGWTFSP